MSLTLDRMIFWFRKELGILGGQEVDDTDIVELLNMALWNVESNFKFHTRERCATTATVADQYLYDVSTITRLDSITSIAVVDDDGQRHKLSRTTRHWLDANANFSEDSGLPTRYLRERDILTLHPVPDDDYTLTVNHRRGVESLLQGTVEGTGLPRNWDEIVLSGAIWRGWKLIKGDYEKAKDAANVTGALITMSKSVEDKETVDSRFARLNVIWEFPEETLEGDESAHW